MTRLFLFLLLILFCDNSFAQKMPQDYFDEGIAAENASKNDEAITAFAYIVKHHPHNELYQRSFYNIGWISYESEKYTEAVKIFKQILKGNFDDLEPSGRRGLMSDPYAEYKHNAASLLSEIYSDRQVYDSALFYLFQSDTLYPYKHFCGNALAENEVGAALAFAELYEKLHQIKEAERRLLNVAFVHGIASNGNALLELEKLFKKNENSIQLKQNLDVAINDIVIDTSYYKNDTEYTYYIVLDGQKIDTRFSLESLNYRLMNDTSEPEMERVKAYLKKSNFYKMVAEL